MIYGSVCSGIEAASAAWHPLGWKPAFFSEIEPFPRAVLAHHYPTVPLHGDFTTIGADDYGPIDLLVGGTPCQSFSIAGLRGGLDDDRGNLALEFLRLADRKRPRWLVWENVPGVLSSNGGRDFGSILRGMAELGYGFAYRVLDAQYFGVAQRRRRVFVVGYLGDWRRAAAVLFERHSMSGHPAPRRSQGKDVAGTFKACANSGGWSNSADHAAAGYMIPVAKCLTARGAGGGNCDPKTSNMIPVAFGWQNSAGQGDSVSEHVTPTLDKSKTPAVCAPLNTQLGLRGADTSNTSREGVGIGNDGDPSFTLQAAHSHAVISTSSVRRLTPVECEKLQGFPSGFTAIPYRNKPADACPDGPRYKALGNSMAVPVMRWIGERIQMVESLGLARDGILEAEA
jgi:DNA (cytosine-5)-methyltransferase 1